MVQSFVNVECIYAPFLESKQNEFSEYVIKNNFFYQKGSKTYLKHIFGVL